MEQKLNKYHAQLLTFYLQVYTKMDIANVEDFLLSHFKMPLAYLWNVKDYPNDPLNDVGFKVFVNYHFARCLGCHVRNDELERIENGVQNEYYYDISVMNIAKVLIEKTKLDGTYFFNIIRPFFFNPFDLVPNKLKTKLEAGTFTQKHRRIEFDGMNRFVRKLITEITVGKGNPDWGAPADREVIIIKFV